MSVTDDYLKNNEAYAAAFAGPLPLPPSKTAWRGICSNGQTRRGPLIGSARSPAMRRPKTAPSGA